MASTSRTSGSSPTGATVRATAMSMSSTHTGSSSGQGSPATPRPVLRQSRGARPLTGISLPVARHQRSRTIRRRPARPRHRPPSSCREMAGTAHVSPTLMRRASPGRCSVRIPAAASEIEPAAKRQRAVDDDDLLMLGRADRVVIVVAHLHAPPRPPAESVDRRKLAPLREDHRVVPDQHADFEAAAALDQEIEKVAEQLRRISNVVVELRAAVEIPADDDGWNSLRASPRARTPRK